MFQDRELIVVDKDAGLLSVPLEGLRSPSVKEALDRALQRQRKRSFTVHRIDRYTSGLILFALSPRARDALVEQFRSHTPERHYLALVRGTLDGDSGSLRHRLQQNRDDFRQNVVSSGGSVAVLHYRVRERLLDATLLEVQLETGLKNQIRVQFAAAGHPLVGDRQMDPREEHDPLGRQALHAWRLAFEHPATRQRMRFEAPLPVDLEAALKRARRPSPASCPPAR
ncbi:MAG: RluA family pseudouridine synthase [Pseudomonadota bacterium]